MCVCERESGYVFSIDLFGHLFVVSQLNNNI